MRTNKKNSGKKNHNDIDIRLMQQLFLVFFLINSFVATTQSLMYDSAEPHFTNYSIENGLISNEVYHVTCDSKGFIWMGTDKGVAKFDGKEFKKFDIGDGLKENSTYKLFEDHKGNMWCTGSSNELCYIKNDSVYNYRYNDIINELIQKDAINLGFYCDSSDNIHLSYNIGGYLVIFKNGEYAFHGPKSQKENRDGIFFTIVENKAVLAYSYITTNMLKLYPFTHLTKTTIYNVTLNPKNKTFKEVAVDTIVKSNYNSTIHSVTYGVLEEESSIHLLYAGSLISTKNKDRIKLPSGGVGINQIDFLTLSIQWVKLI